MLSKRCEAGMSQSGHETTILLELPIRVNEHKDTGPISEGAEASRRSRRLQNAV